MINKEITLEQLRDFILRQAPMTFDVYDKAKAADPDDVFTTRWASGRIDGLLQIIQVIDSDAFDMLLADRHARMGTENWTDEFDDLGN
ncbi:hypothetical protein [Prescottella equi]|uniref:Uncharacterized protein n=1 Tax=Prescottella equi ATCC 33707 TaxID=525370 RepID=E9T0M1_RHOHA|nr:hypothetical protein [Prescottella equi]EGD23972.1 hypothetical protein HMPREF0724_12180 [Prescottella equi ATCC 33707]